MNKWLLIGIAVMSCLIFTWLMLTYYPKVMTFFIMVVIILGVLGYVLIKLFD